MKPIFQQVRERIRFLKEPNVDSLYFTLQVQGFWQYTLDQKREWLMDSFDMDASAMDELDIHRMLDSWMVWEQELQGWDDEPEQSIPRKCHE